MSAFVRTAPQLHHNFFSPFVVLRVMLISSVSETSLTHEKIKTLPALLLFSHSH